MNARVDHLRVGQRLRVIQKFTDAQGLDHEVGERGEVLAISIDWRQQCLTIDWNRLGHSEPMRFDLRADEGPRSGAMHLFFGEDRGEAEPLMIVASDARPEDEVQGPAWWIEAVALEGADQFDEAEQAIRRAVDHLGFASSIAELYARRMRRMLKAGDHVQARDAFERADRWICSYAGFATSGGEGVALSEERDQFLRELGVEWAKAMSANHGDAAPHESKQEQDHA